MAAHGPGGEFQVFSQLFSLGWRKRTAAPISRVLLEIVSSAAFRFFSFFRFLRFVSAAMEGRRPVDRRRRVRSERSDLFDFVRIWTDAVEAVRSRLRECEWCSGWSERAIGSCFRNLERLVRVDCI